MRLRSLTFGSVIAIALGASAIITAQPAAARQATDGPVFTVDPVHSMVVFRVGHLGVANFYGIFERAEGTYNIDPSNPAASFVKMTIPVENIDSGNDRRDGHLKSADFFNAKQFPTITFESTGVKNAGTNRMAVEGNLTMLGVTRPVTAELEFLGEGDTQQGYKSGFEAVFNIKRSEWGMTKYLEGDAIGDNVRLIVAVEGKRN